MPNVSSNMEAELTTQDWADLASSDKEWAVKRKELIDELNRRYGHDFAKGNGDFIRVVRNEKILDIRAVTASVFRIGNLLHLGNDTGTPVAADKMIYYLDEFARNIGG